jgi:DNA polymerase III epsilon subunit-like protein
MPLLASSGMEAEIKPNTATIVFFDLETGGLNPQRHPIIQLAALAVRQDLEPLEAIELKIRFDESKANKSSLRKNNYQRGLWAREALEPREAARLLAAFLKTHAQTAALTQRGKELSLAQLAAHNAAFDGPFLKAWYERLGVFLPARYQVLCTLQRAKWHFAERPYLRAPENFKLATLCDYYRVPFHAADAHDALGDVTATFLLYRALANAERSSCDHLFDLQRNVAGCDDV